MSTEKTSDLVYDTLLSRRSVKKYAAQMPDAMVLEKIVRAGLAAPSGMNRQSSKIIVVRDPALRESLRRTNAEILNAPESDPFYGAPVVLVVLTDERQSTAIYDGTLTAANLLHAAHALDLGACWIHRAKETFERDEWREWLREQHIPDSFVGVANIIVGYPEGPERPCPAVKEGRVIWH